MTLRERSLLPDTAHARPATSVDFSRQEGSYVTVGSNAEVWRYKGSSKSSGQQSR